MLALNRAASAIQRKNQPIISQTALHVVFQSSAHQQIEIPELQTADRDLDAGFAHGSHRVQLTRANMKI